MTRCVLGERPAPVVGVLLAGSVLMGSLVPSPAAGQEAAEPFQFEGIPWSSPPDTVRKRLLERGYEPVQEDGTAYRFNGRYLNQPVRVEAKFSADSAFQAAVVNFVQRKGVTPFRRGIIKGITSARGQSCVSASTRSSGVRTWKSSTGGLVTALRIEGAKKQMRLILLGPDRARDISCQKRREDRSP